MKIKIFSVGGTIHKVYFDQLSEYQVGFPSVREILDGLPIAFEITRSNRYCARTASTWTKPTESG